MKLKCIGGPSDGRVFDLSASYMEIKVPNPARFLPAHGLEDFCEVHTFSFTIYTRRVLRDATKAEVHYLAPAGVGDVDSIRHLLEAK
jgi:hypothetical protein